MGRPQTPLKETTLEPWTQPQSQRRVTFHLPDGSQESCSDSGLGDHEPNGSASASHPLPLGFPQEEYYEQASPNSRTEGDGNSDPESMTATRPELRGCFPAAVPRPHTGARKSLYETFLYICTRMRYFCPRPLKAG
ncbi:protocadherin-11 X-linked-like [Rhea pennata]|uniref:protocadherin-11 X-linked-like n=1 Tax=Rhea pennata TaxID=8795 RepID=UPI002E2737E1